MHDVGEVGWLWAACVLEVISRGTIELFMPEATIRRIAAVVSSAHVLETTSLEPGKAFVLRTPNAGISRIWTASPLAIYIGSVQSIDQPHRARFVRPRAAQRSPSPQVLQISKVCALAYRLQRHIS